jgi:hypothetical protein
MGIVDNLNHLYGTPKIEGHEKNDLTIHPDLDPRRTSRNGIPLPGRKRSPKNPHILESMKIK